MAEDLDLDALSARYFVQLTRGCSRAACQNKHCANCKGATVIRADEASVLALALARAGPSGLCDEQPGSEYLDLDLVRHALDASPGQPGEEALRALVRRAFAHSRALERSFARAPSADELDSIDWAQLAGFWALASAPERGGALLDAIADAIEAGGLQPPCARAIVLVLSCPALLEPQYHETVLAPAYAAAATLGGSERRALVELWARAPAPELRHALRTVHQYLIIAVLQHTPLSDPVEAEVESAVLALALLKEASDASAEPLELRAFYNDGVNEELVQHEEARLRQDYRRWLASAPGGGGGGGAFAFCSHPCVLEPATKASVLKLSALHQMSSEFESAVFRSLLTMSMHSPFLVLRVRRDRLIRDCLHQLSSRRADLKKPLKVHFVGEEGVDEGGVQKEFFQLVVHQLFDPVWGMFVQDEKTRECWFNQNSLEASGEFELIGMLIGLAIYNGVILDVRFPSVVYKKLMRRPCDFTDLQRAFPALAHGLRQLLAHEGDVRELCLTFAVDEDVFGARRVTELRPGGAEVEVTAENRAEYVAAYTAHVLEGSVAKQFDAFNAGFQSVCGGPALQLFHWEELELLICGSPHLDFEALQRATRYDDGFDAEHPTIVLFWAVLHSLALDLQCKFLQFATGSDRVPIKGLGTLRLVISRHGSDEARLPSAHTCFNHLLLPEYKTAEVVRTQLLKAICNAEGFHIV